MWLFRFTLILHLVLSADVLHAQSTNASLAGRVTDLSNALIVDAKVAAISVDTNIRYEGVTNSAGEFYLTNLLPGTYRIEIEKSGFKKLVRPDVFLHVQDALEINLQMVLGSASEIVTVQSGVPVIDVESTSVSTVIDRTYVESLPLNGRSLQTFLLLSPGVVLTATAFDDQGQFSVNGQRADANYFTIDGVSANFGVTGFAPLMQSAAGALPALSALGGTNSLVSVDAMQEFRIQTSSFAPEFGRTPGGQISVLTRSGTNSFHATLFDYFRNGALDANNWFSNLNHLQKTQELQNDFGGVFGGPIRKDKTFFFFSYEGLRLLQPSTLETVVPDAASRQQASTAVQPYLNAYPVPNGVSLGQGLAQFNADYSNPSALDAVSIRVDHNVNSKTTLFGRYNYSPSSSERTPALSFGSVLSTKEFASFSVQTFTVGLTNIINHEISNDVRVNYSNNRVGIRYALDHFGGADPVADSVLFPPGFSSANSSYTFTIIGAGQFADGNFGIDEQRQLNLVDSLSVITSSHQLKVGVDYRRLAPFSSRGPYGQLAEFSGMSTAPGGALSNPATALVADSIAHQSDALLSQNCSLYAQDTWKITPRLTLVYGLRWDVNPPLKGNNPANHPFTVEGLNNPSTMTLAPRGTPLYTTTYGNVAPRLGLAYQLREPSDWGSVLRAGGGIFYDLGSGSLGGVSSYFPYSATKVFSLWPFPLSPQDAAPPLLTVNPPVLDILVAEPNLKLPRTYEWNIALEQSLGSSQSLSLTYVGAVGRDLLRSTVLNPVSAGNPVFDFVFLTDNSATSNYNALQLKFQRRFWKGLQALASYSFSHSIDISSTDAAFAYLDPVGSVTNPNIDRGDSDFDIRHSFTAAFTYDLPSLGARNFIHNILGGWSLDSFVIVRSAPPVNIVGAQIFAGVAVLMPRPDIKPGLPLVLYGSQYPGGKAFNPAAFVPAPNGQQGDLGRNVLRAFGAWQADLGLQRQFRVTKEIALRFRAEFFNIFNHPNFGSPNNILSSPLFGLSTQMLANSLAGGNNAGFNPLYQIGGPRSIQLAIRLQF